jgi:DNA-binding LacI/PurR family transcriptional regulator
MVLGSITERGWRHRLLGYRAALEQAGLPFRWDYIADANIVEPPADVESGVDAMSRATAQFKSQIRVAFDRIMASPRKPTAIIAGDDRRAAMLLDICCERGVHVPGDLSIVGFPNSPESRLTTPPLTVVDGCYEQISEAAMQMLLDQMFQGADPYAQQAVIQPRLVVRASTAKPSGLRKKNNVDTAENSKNLESRR